MSVFYSSSNDHPTGEHVKFSLSVILGDIRTIIRQSQYDSLNPRRSQAEQNIYKSEAVMKLQKGQLNQDELDRNIVIHSSGGATEIIKIELCPMENK